MITNGNEPATGYTMISPDGSNHLIETGLTKREHFASLALQGLCANYLRDNIQGWNIKDYVIKAVSLADELIKQLNQNEL